MFDQSDDLADNSPTPRVRVIALGDDLLAGVGDARCLGWLGRAVAADRPSGHTVEVFSAPLPGENTASLSLRWEREVHARMIGAGDTDRAPSPRVVIGLGRADARDGVSLARSRLNLAKVLDGLERARIPSFVVGPPPSTDSELNTVLVTLSQAFEDVCARRRVPYVDTVQALEDHEQWNEDLERGSHDFPGQTGYGLMAWLVLHAGFSGWLTTGTLPTA